MSEISRFSWWFIGLLLIIISVAINWKKFFLFVLVGIVFMFAGFVKHGKKRNEKKEKLRREREMITKKLAMDRLRKNSDNN